MGRRGPPAGTQRDQGWGRYRQQAPPKEGATLGPLDLLPRLESRVLLVPVVARLAHELLKLGACHADRPHSRWLLVPGLVVRKLTTRELDDRRLEAALAALIRVLAAGGRVAPEAPRLGAARRIDAGAPPLVPAAPLPNAAE